jgi:GNAT superfamily N-acetyltransferase
MPGKLLIRFTVEIGSLCGEVSLFDLAKADDYVRRRSTEPFVELSDLFVDPKARGYGLGRHLLKNALEYAQDRGWIVFLRVIPYDNSPCSIDDLKRFYKRYGFKSYKKDEREMIWRPRKPSMKAR